MATTTGDGGRVGFDNEFTQRNTTIMTWNLMHMARMLHARRAAQHRQRPAGLVGRRAGSISRIRSIADEPCRPERFALSGHGAASLAPGGAGSDLGASAAEAAGGANSAGMAGDLLGVATERGTRILHSDMPGVVELLEWLAAGIDILAIVVMGLGALRFAIGFVAAEARRGDERLRRMNIARLELGRYILAGLEVLIVSDIIHTALSLAFGDLIFLGLLVLIRSAVSFFLTREIKDLKHELAAPDSG